MKASRIAFASGIGRRRFLLNVGMTAAAIALGGRKASADAPTELRIGTFDETNPTAILQAQGSLDSHFRYLSGLLAAIGVAYWTTIPEIEKEAAKFGLLTVIVVAGGVSRALGMLIAGPPGPAMSAALIMELVVTPVLYLWQARVQRLAPPVDATPAQG